MSTESRTDQPIDREAIHAMRRSYGESGLHESDALRDPIKQFQSWLEEAAKNAVIVEANAMVLSTIADGKPASRTVLMKDVSEEGFSFFTNYESAKAQQIGINPQVSLLFPWYAMERQVIINGTAKKVAEEITNEYFASRPWGSQIGAWASSQSEDLDSREVLEVRYKEFSEKYPQGSSVPTPPHWGGYLVTPQSIEFWQGRYSRLHDRLKYTRGSDAWQITRLHP